MKIEGTPVYLDVEGLPDRDFYYLIGVRLGNRDSVAQYSLWADGVDDERRIWSEFLDILTNTKDPVLIHYGSATKPYSSNVWPIVMACLLREPQSRKRLSTSVNLLSVIFAQVYFPTLLKQPEGHRPLSGCEVEWTRNLRLPEPCSSSRMGDVHPSRPKAALLTYNRDDCAAIESVTSQLTPDHPRSEVESGCRVLRTNPKKSRRTRAQKFTLPLNPS